MTDTQEVYIVKIISEHKGAKGKTRPQPGMKRVMAVIKFSKGSRQNFTRHVDTRDGVMGTLAPIGRG